MTETELVAALEWAIKVHTHKMNHPESKYAPQVDCGARALLDAARLIREHEWPGYYGYCAECASTEPEGHAPKCKGGMWVRAAVRAGL